MTRTRGSDGMQMKRIEDGQPRPVVEEGHRPLIVHVVRQFLPNRGGLEDVVRNLCRQALQRGFRIRVVTLDTLFSDPGRNLPDREAIDGIDIVRIGWRGSPRYPIAPAVLAHIGDADLVHVHAVDFFFDFLALTRPIHRKPMIATTHGGFFHTRRFAAIKAVWFKTLTRFSASRYACLVGCSGSDVRTFLPIAPAIRLIENGVDIDKFRGRAAQLPVKHLVTLGRFSSNKRLDRLIDTMRVLVASDPDWLLDIVGVPSDLTEGDLRGLAEGLENNIRIHIGADNAEIGRLMGQCSLFVSASEYEGFGLVAIEAMSAGLLPVLQHNSAYTALGARHDLIAIGDFGRPETGAKLILDTWERLSTDPAGIRTALIEASEAYSWSTVAEQYMDAYRSLLLGSRRR